MIDQIQSRTVLLVEDWDDDAFFFERAFRRSGMDGTLVRVIDGGAAVEYLKRAAGASRDITRSHIIFLDLKLPVLSGFDVLRWIRDQELAAEVIVLSGSDLDTDVAAARRLGASDYLVKPIAAADIKRVLQEKETPVVRS